MKINNYQWIFSLLCWPGELVVLVWLIIELLYNKVSISEMSVYINEKFIPKLHNKILQNIFGGFNVLVYIWIFS